MIHEDKTESKVGSPYSGWHINVEIQPGLNMLLGATSLSLKEQHKNGQN